jgi:hypothetical protein
MNNFFIVQPSVDGESGNIPNHLLTPTEAQHADYYEYVFSPFGWIGDDLFCDRAYFVCTPRLCEALKKVNATGAVFASMRTFQRDIEDEEHEGHTLGLPEFVWLKAIGRVGVDDFAIYPKGTLVISERCLEIMQTMSIKNASIYRWDGEDITYLRKTAHGDFEHVDNSHRLVQLAESLRVMEERRRQLSEKQNE